MDAGDVNGGNAEVAREDPNLETTANMPDLQETQDEQTVKMEVQELNGDVKGSPKKTTPNVRRKLRKFKANSTSSVEADESPKSRGRKRKLSEPDDASSEESMEFNGFDTKNPDEIGAGSNILRKLIAEAEEAEAMMAKRVRYSTLRKDTDTGEKKEDDQDSDDNKTHPSELEGFNLDKVKKEKESDKSETESVGMANSVDSEVEASKAEDSSHKSANSSATSSPSGISQKSKSSRLSRNASPGAIKQKALDHMSNPAFKEPFKYGWKRELVFRGTTDSSLKRMADVYYYSPKGKKLRSLREVAEFLNTKDLTVDNFTFFKEPLGVDDPEREIIRDARKVGRSVGATPTPPKKAVFSKRMPAKKVTPIRKPTPVKKAVDESPAAAPPPSTPNTTTSIPMTSPPAATTPVSAKTAIKSPKTRSGFKLKMPVKKTPQIKMKSADETEMLPPQKSPANIRRNPVQTLQPTEKATPLKTKRLLTPKVQEPCSIRCSTSMGLIPSLQCRVCLCLYHPECVGGTELTSSDDYVCKNCRQESNDAQQNQSMNPSLTPPPLIPISMIGSQGTKTKHQVNLTPPKLQRIPKSDGTESPTRNASKHSKATMISYSSPAVDKREGTWFAQAENEFLQSPDGTIPKPAQNIAVMAGKRYIVVPKNNAMAVQPAITVKPDKIGDKPPILQDGGLIDVSNTIESFTDPVSKVASIKDVDERITSEEVQKDESSPVLVSTASTETANEIQQDESANKEAMDTSVTENEPSTINVPIETNNDTDSKPVDNISNSTLASSSFNVECSDSDVNKTESQEPVSVNQGITQTSNKRKQNQQETDQQQHFMESVSAGYHALLRIFQYLKVQELLRAARVSKMWRDLAAHPSLWKTVRMKNSQVTDWDGLADTLQRRGTQYLDLRKMLVAGESDNIWRKFLSVIPRVTSLVKLELCRCPAMVVEEVIKSCPQLEVLSAMSIKCDSLNLESVGNLKQCQELRLKAISGMSLQDDLSPLQDLTQLTQLSLTSVKELGKKKIDVIQTLVNLETLELGECSDFPDKFGTTILIKLQKLERLRLEKGQGSCCTFDILEGVSKLDNLSQLELVNFDVKNGFDKCLANCKNIKRLLIIPTYISQSATSNNMVLGGVTELSNNLTHFVWGVTLELLRVTELFVDQCNLMNKQVTGDSIPVLKPVPCLKLIEDVEDENDNQKGDDKQPNLTSPQVDILPLPQLQKLLLTALPKTRVKILKIPFHATWRQSISDTATQ